MYMYIYICTAHSLPEMGDVPYSPLALLNSLKAMDQQAMSSIS